MAFKKLGRFIGTVALGAAMLAVPMTMSGCSTDHPKAEITIEYNDKQYVLEYTMYRKLYPQTVQHFIELADEGFYDNTIVHNYSSSTYLYCGGYDLVDNSIDDYKKVTAASASDGERREYMKKANKDAQYAELAKDVKKLTPSVYRDYQGDYVDPLPTLIGEFSNNQHTILDDGENKSGFGNLRMYYSSKSDELIKNGGLQDGCVYINKSNTELPIRAPYKYNSATSMFSVQLSTPSTPSKDSNYAIFAVLDDETALKELLEELKNSGATRKVTLDIDTKDEIIGYPANTADYWLTQSPVIIRSVKITKY